MLRLGRSICKGSASERSPNLLGSGANDGFVLTGNSEVSGLRFYLPAKREEIESILFACCAETLGTR